MKEKLLPHHAQAICNFLILGCLPVEDAETYVKWKQFGDEAV